MQANVFVGAGALAMGLALTASSDAAQPTAAAPLADWPRIESPVKTDAALEARIARIVAGMTLEQKIGQMTQPEIKVGHARRSAPVLHRLGAQRRRRLAGR